MELINENAFNTMNYELLKALDGGKDVTITFKIIPHMSMQQATNAQGWVYVAAGLPYVVFMP